MIYQADRMLKPVQREMKKKIKIFVHNVLAMLLTFNFYLVIGQFDWPFPFLVPILNQLFRVICK